MVIQWPWTEWMSPYMTMSTELWPAGYLPLSNYSGMQMNSLDLIRLSALGPTNLSELPWLWHPTKVIFNKQVLCLGLPCSRLIHRTRLNLCGLWIDLRLVILAIWTWFLFDIVSFWPVDAWWGSIVLLLFYHSRISILMRVLFDVLFPSCSDAEKWQKVLLKMQLHLEKTEILELHQTYFWITGS